MGLNLDHADGQTPLNEDEKDGLLIETITTRGELDEFEQQNIEKAVEWTMQRKFRQESILTETFIKEVHNQALGIPSWSCGYNILSDDKKSSTCIMSSEGQIQSA